MSPLVLPPLALADVRRWGAAGVVLLAVLAVAAWRLTETGPWLLGAPVVLAAAVLWVSTRRVRVDPAEGTLAVERGPWRRAVALRDADWVHLADVGHGVMALLVMPSDGGLVRVGVLVVGRVGEECRDPDTLRVLAGVLETHVHTEDPLGAVLRLQADHLERGGDVASSPLASVVLEPRTRRGPGRGSSSSLARLLE